MFSEALSMDHSEAKNTWVIDSGCTFHMTSRKDWLLNFTECDPMMILLGDNHTVESKGCGTVRLNTNGGSIKMLKNVRYVPNIRRNLISTGTLDKLGYTHQGGDGLVSFYSGDKLALRGRLSGGLYVLDGNTELSENLNTENQMSKTALWHSRLGHMNLNSLKVLVGKGLIVKKEIQELEFCEHCVLGKSKKLSFNVGRHNTKDVLGYIHADLWGSPNVTPSLSGKQYFLSIVDDKSRKAWLMFLKTKDETFEKFCEWKELVENQISKKVKILRTDNGLEFCNRKFDEYCKKHGIERHHTCTYTPQQNGIAERMNRTLMEKVRCWLSESGLSEEFWAEAASTAAYIVNRSPCSAIDHNVPEELWLNRKPGYQHLRRFGSVAYVHQDQGKLKPRALKGVFLGYPQGVKGYKVWLLEDEKCVISRNVVFQEQKVFKDIKENEHQAGDQTGTRSTSAGVHGVSMTDDLVTWETGESSDKGGVTENSDKKTPVTESSTEEENKEATETVDLAGYQLAKDRTRREIVPFAWMSDYSNIACALVAAGEIESDEPQCYHDALTDKDWDLWNASMSEEFHSLKKNRTWDLVDRPKDRNVITCRWLYKVKPGIPGVEKKQHKSRLVARGFTQREGIDYEEVFAPVVKHISIRILTSIVVTKDLELEQMDVKTVFLHGNLEQELYMEQPEGYEENTARDQVCRLNKSLYGLKQAPRQWNKRFNVFIMSQGFIRSEQDSCVYIKEIGPEDYVYLLLYVDDILLAAKQMSEIKMIKDQLSSEFEMKDMGPASRILGIDIKRDRVNRVLELCQVSYLEKVIRRFHMEESKAVSTPIGAHFKLAAVKAGEDCVDTDQVPYLSAVGSIMYAMVGTRPDVSYALGLVSRFMSKPGSMHWEAVKWLLRYLKGSLRLTLRFTEEAEFKVQGYSDSDFGGDLDKKRSLSGYVFIVGGNTVSWKSSLQPVVALSTTEAEYIALTEAVKEAIWIKELLREMGFEQEKVSIWCDSQSAISLSKIKVFHERTKHVARKFHFIRDVIEEGEVEVLKIHTSRNPADMLTKCIPVHTFEAALELLKLTDC